MGRWSVKLAVALLKYSRLQNEDRQLLTTAMLDRLGALPIRATIRIDDTGEILVADKKLTVDAAKRIHESSKSMIDNFARKFVREQVTFMAIKQGVHENISPEQGLFAKAVLWFYQEEEELYRRFAQLDQE